MNFSRISIKFKRRNEAHKKLEIPPKAVKKTSEDQPQNKSLPQIFEMIKAEEPETWNETAKEMSQLQRPYSDFPFEKIIAVVDVGLGWGMGLQLKITFLQRKIHLELMTRVKTYDVRFGFLNLTQL